MKYKVRLNSKSLTTLLLALEVPEAVFYKTDELNKVIKLPKEVQQAPERLADYLEKTVQDRTGCLLLTDNYALLEEGQKLLPCVAYARTGCLDKVPMSCRYVIEESENLCWEELQRIYLRICGLPLTIAETERLILRELSEDDIGRLYEISMTEQVRRYVDDIPADREEAYAHIRAYIKQVYPFYGYGYWGIYLKESGELIGRCGLQEGTVREVAEETPGGACLGYLLDPAYTGAGYATEAVRAVIRYAFEELGLNCISAIIREDNRRSVAVAEACGLVRAEETVQDGERCYCYRTAISRNE